MTQKFSMEPSFSICYLQTTTLYKSNPSRAAVTTIENHDDSTKSTYILLPKIHNNGCTEVTVWFGLDKHDWFCQSMRSMLKGHKIGLPTRRYVYWHLSVLVNASGAPRSSVVAMPISAQIGTFWQPAWKLVASLPPLPFSVRYSI